MQSLWEDVRCMRGLSLPHWTMKQEQVKGQIYTTASELRFQPTQPEVGRTLRMTSGRCRDKGAGPSFQKETYCEVTKPADKFPRDTAHCSQRGDHLSATVWMPCRAVQDTQYCCFPFGGESCGSFYPFDTVYDSKARLNGDVFLRFHSWQQNWSKVKTCKMR